MSMNEAKIPAASSKISLL